MRKHLSINQDDKEINKAQQTYPQLQSQVLDYPQNHWNIKAKEWIH